MGGVSAGGRGAGGEGAVWGEAPVGALEEDLGPQAPEEVVHEDGAPEEGLGVVDEAHLLQGEAQHVGALLQHRSNLRTRWRYRARSADRSQTPDIECVYR